MAENREKFHWLELRPQQKFRDDSENRMLGILRHVTQFAFFVMCRGGEMRITARVPHGEGGIFKAVPGITAVEAASPDLGNMLAECLVPRGSSLVPLVDPRSVAKGGVYQRIWATRRDSVMACFACDRTRQVLAHLNARIRSLERAEKEGAGLSSRNRAELAAAMQKRDGHHSYYYCRIIFGLGVSQSRGKASAREDRESLGSLSMGTLQTSFAHRIARKRAEFSRERKGISEKVRSLLLGTVVVNPDTLVPKGQSSKNLVLTESELAYFVSFPEEYDIRTINFGMGATPTFVHGSTQEIGETDLTTDF